MGTLTEKSEWTEGVRYFEAGVWVTGGPDSSENDPIRDLANRTVWLKETQATLTGRIKVVETGLAEHTEAEDPHPQYVTSPEMESRIGRIEIQGQINADWNATEGAAEILNKPELSTVALSGNYADLSGIPQLSAVALSGSYSDLTNAPANLATDDDINLLQASKADKDLANVSQTGKDNTVKWGMPDYHSGINQTALWGNQLTAPVAGYIWVIDNSTSGSHVDISIGPVTFVVMLSGTTPAGVTSGCLFPVRKGEQYTATGGQNGARNLLFFPCIGG